MKTSKDISSGKKIYTNFFSQSKGCALYTGAYYTRINTVHVVQRSLHRNKSTPSSLPRAARNDMLHPGTSSAAGDHKMSFFIAVRSLSTPQSFAVPPLWPANHIIILLTSCPTICTTNPSFEQFPT